MPSNRPLAIALLAASLTLALMPLDADAQRRRAAPKPPPGPTACTDFYGFVNKDWLTAHPSASGSPSMSVLAELQQRTLQQQQDLLDAAMQAPQNDIQKLLGDFWASGLDEAAVEADGAQPIATLLSRINAIRRAKDIAPTIAALHQVGIPVAFNFSADLDLANLDRHIGYFSEGGLGLPDPAYYTRTDEDTRALLGRYTDYVKRILQLTGTPEARLAAEAQQVIDLETRIAGLSRPILSMRDPRTNYALVPTDGFAKQYKNLRLQDFLKAQGVTDPNVSLANTQLFTQLDGWVGSLKADQWKAYLRFQVGNAMAPYLSKDFRDAEFAFQGRVLRGETQPQPRKQLVLDAINRAAGPMMAREYVAKHLPEATRTRATSVAESVRDALARGVDRSPWMSEPTKAEARAKLAALKIEVGAPRDDLDYTVQPMGRASFGSNMLIASTWHFREEMRRIGRGNASRRWDVLPQQPVLAYDVAHNRLIVSAGVLQPPGLDAGYDTASTYGSFGALIGHELSRAIDNRGQLVDAKGDVRNWWTPADLAAWENVSVKVATQYNAYPYPAATGTNVNGFLTKDENTADLAAVELAWDALNTVQPTLSPAEREAFFKGWALLWREQTSPETAAFNATTSVHAPGQWRTNGPLANQPAFAEVFKCKLGTGMVRKAEDQISIWR
ncbi:M13 family metallopeptidase [Luteimonas sp. RIT-PG2_3]